MPPFILPEYNSRPNGQKALGPKEVLPHPNFWEQYILGLSQDRTWIKDGQGVNNSNIQQCPSRVRPGQTQATCHLLRPKVLLGYTPESWTHYSE